MNFDRELSPASTANEVCHTGIAVIGGTLFCSTQTCDHMELEFSVRCVKANSIERLKSLCPQYAGLRLLIVDEDLAGDLLIRAEAYCDLNPAATLALGYRNVDIARQHFELNRKLEGPPIGYLSMNAPLEVLLSSMRMLFHGEYFLPHCLLDEPITSGTHCAAKRPEARLQSEEDAETVKKFSRLTGREREILELVSGGSSNKQIARQLGITEHTVKLHMHNLFGKFGVSNRTAAANMYFSAQARDAYR